MKALALTLTLLGCLSTAAVAQGMKPSKPSPPVTADQRQKMAEVHEKAATCLRSERPLAECHDEMSKGCKDAMGAACPMMGGMGSMKHHGQMMEAPKTE